MRDFWYTLVWLGPYAGLWAIRRDGETLCYAESSEIASSLCRIKYGVGGIE